MGRALRGTRYEDYGISKQRYLELKALCRQYREMKERIGYGLSAVKGDGMPRGYDVSQPTERAALRNLGLLCRVQMIEVAAERATKGLGKVCYHGLMLNVTDGIPFYDLNLPIDRKDFSAYRRLFFHELDLLEQDTRRGLHATD